MAYDSRRNVLVLFGGAQGETLLDDTWEREGTTWSSRATSPSPPARTGASLVYDSSRGVTILFGGLIAGGAFGDASFLADTWEWDGQTWTNRTPSVSPGARYYAAAAYDASRSAVVLFGGSDRGHTAFDETWEWDGESWTRFPGTSSSPSARADATMVYDAARGACILFGGDDGTLPRDTWQRTGTVWQELSPATRPPDRRGAGMAFDAARGVTVLFGGHSGPRPPDGKVLDDTWEWDGTDWTLLDPPAAPPARSALAMAFDAARGVSVLFGGQSGGPGHADTWEWDGTTWTKV